MFVDYYDLLNVSPNADVATIKSAYKQQAIKWHPDSNPNEDTTERMQLINEAYLILKDAEARNLYNIAYNDFIDKKRKRSEDQNSSRESGNDQTKDSKSRNTAEDYEVDSDLLRRWILNARNQSKTLAKQSLEDLKGMSKVGGAAIVESALKGIVKYIIFGVLFLIIMRACRD